MRNTHHPLLLFLLVLLSLLPSCSTPRYTNHFYPPEPLPPGCVPEKIQVALVLGSGGARGAAHIGVLEELIAAHIPIDVIIGCSAGSVVGALYADTLDIEYVKSVLLDCGTSKIIDFSIFCQEPGLAKGEAFKEYLGQSIHARTFHELHIPLFVAATDICTGELIPLCGGPLIPAVYASACVPVVFPPISLHGRLLVDGGIADPVPVQIAKKLKPDIIIAVPLYGKLEAKYPKNVFEIAERSSEIMMFWLNHCSLQGADVLIIPDVCRVRMFDDSENIRSYWEGRHAARRAIPQIKELIRQKQQQTMPFSSE